MKKTYSELIAEKLGNGSDSREFEWLWNTLTFVNPKTARIPLHRPDFLKSGHVTDPYSSCCAKLCSSMGIRSSPIVIFGRFIVTWGKKVPAKVFKPEPGEVLGESIVLIVDHSYHNVPFYRDRLDSLWDVSEYLEEPSMIFKEFPLLPNPISLANFP